MIKVKTSELNTRSKADLEKQLHQCKTELSEIRVSKITNGAVQKLGKIRVLRKSIARILTVMHTKQKESLRELYSGKSLKPIGLRAKQTRAMRRALTDKQKNMKTMRQARLDKAWPERMYAVKA